MGCIYAIELDGVSISPANARKSDTLKGQVMMIAEATKLEVGVGQADVMGIGISTVDYLFTVPQMPVYGGRIVADNYLKQGGGLVATALVALARLGASCAMIGRIADDEEGKYIHAQLAKEGVDTSLMIREVGTCSHVAVVLVDQKTGERSFVPRVTDISPLEIDELPRHAIESAKVLFVDNINEVTLQAAQWARDAGVCTVLDPSPPFEVIQDLLPLIDVPIVPEKFAHAWMPDALKDEAVCKMAEELYDLGAKIAVVTCGDQGCVVRWEKGLFRFSAFPIDVVDTTGAGDAFHGAFIYGLLQEWSVEEVVRFASAVGTLNCRYLGGRTGLPTRDEVDAFIADHEGLFVATLIK
ncbi:MAG: PfkB family carbohydrate kinase [Chloroflexota bacterium]